jgi:hypothetical protein
MAAAARSRKRHFIRHESPIVVVESIGATLIEDHGDVSGQSPGASCAFLPIPTRRVNEGLRVCAHPNRLQKTGRNFDGLQKFRTEQSSPAQRQKLPIQAPAS